MTDSPQARALLTALRRRRVATAAELMQDAGLNSQPTFSRAVAALGEQVVTIGRARSRRYAAARDGRGLGLALPLYRVDAAGKPVRIATVRPIQPEGCVIEAAEPMPAYLRGERADGLFEGLPYFLADMQPQGFIGRGFVRRFPELKLPAAPANWSDEDALVALARAGEDCPGELILGEPSLDRFYRTQVGDSNAIAVDAREQAYPQHAEQAMAGTTAGSSAGGEHPKFLATVNDGGVPRHVLVKFSPVADAGVGRRWADLLVSEHLALETLRAAGLPAVPSRLLQAKGRMFLEVDRFDRVGAAGRRPVLSLAGLDATFFGKADAWRFAAERLVARNWLSADDAQTLATLQSFGHFIGNTDMHFGNAALLPAAGEMLTLAPTYDMLPMLYAPVSGELVARDFEVPMPVAQSATAWSATSQLGMRFWNAVAADTRISDAFRATAVRNAATIGHALQRLG